MMVEWRTIEKPEHGDIGLPRKIALALASPLTV